MSFCGWVRLRWGVMAGLLVLFSVHAAAAVWQVNPGQSVQAAIDAAAPGDVIEIRRGHYRGALQVAKALTLRGIDRPTIDGELLANTISVRAENVTIEGLIVSNSGGETRQQHAGVYLYPGSHHAVVRRCDFSYTLFGLWIEKANDVLIEGNLITGKRDFSSPARGNGIQLYNTRRARIIGNKVFRPSVGNTTIEITSQTWQNYTLTATATSSATWPTRCAPALSPSATSRPTVTAMTCRRT